MKRTGSPYLTLPEAYSCSEYTRSIAPWTPLPGYWIPESPPPPPVRWYFEPPPRLVPPPWSSSPISRSDNNTPHQLPTRSPPRFYSPTFYSQNCSPYPHCQDIVVEKQPYYTTPTSDLPNNRVSTTKITPTKSPIKRILKIPKKEFICTPRNRNNKWKYRKALVNKVEVQIKKEVKSYNYYESSNELHPEVLATWRNNLNKSKEISNMQEVKIEMNDLNKSEESSNTQEVKIEICLRKEKQNANQNTKGGKNIVRDVDLKAKQSSKKNNKKKCSPHKKRQPKKMTSSNTMGDDQKSSVERLNSSARKERSSRYEDKSSALRFTPSQLHKVYKKENDHKSSSNYVPIVKALETCVYKEKRAVSPIRFSTSTPEEQRSKISICKNGRDSDSGLETYRSREEYSRSSVKSNFTNGNSVSPRKSSWNVSSSSSYVTQDSSIYVTPEGTPSSMNSKESQEKHSRVKRSLYDEYSDESLSANSSFNNSCYYTPESTPSKYNSAKRLKTKWNDSESFSLDNSSFMSWRHNISISSDQGVQPELIGYQMVGDSQFCRFGQQLLGLERVPMPNSSGRIGICVSGQTITDLHRRVREKFYPISDKIILMIGTNDFLRNVDINTMCKELSALVHTLQKSASNIILLTLPPIPKLEKRNSTAHFKLLNAYNSHIRSLENGETVRIADVSPLYMTSAPYQHCRMDLFEVYFMGAARRLDLIHLNRLGLEIIRKYILDKFV